MRAPASRYGRGVSATPADPTTIGAYRVVERIGEGGMGVVHLAVSPDGGLVAVKTLRPWLVGGTDGRVRFEREMSTLRRVRGERIAEVIDADVTADPPYIVTRYVRGPALAKVVADHGPLRGAALDRLAEGLLDALASVHAAGIVHRDVKPGNVLIADSGPVLIDFGLAHAVDETRLTASGFVAGTPGYLAPETIQGESPSAATDVHGWAATVAYAATGHSPYGSGPDAVVIDRIRRGELDLGGAPSRLATVLAAALRTDPSARPGLAELRARIGAGDSASTMVSVPPVGTAQERAVTAATSASPPASGADPMDATLVLGRTTPPTKIDVAPRPPQPVPPPPRPPVTTPQVRPQVPPRQAQPSLAPHPFAGDGAPLQGWPARLTVAVGALVVLLVSALWPYVGTLVLVALMVLGRVTFRVRRRLYGRRVTRGIQRNDQVLAALASPLDVVATVLPAVIQGAFVLGSGLVVGAAVAAGGFGGPRSPYLVGGAVALLLAWWGPGSNRFRHGIRVLVMPLQRDQRAGWVICAILVVIAWVLVLLWDSYGTSWIPDTGPPNPFRL